MVPIKKILCPTDFSDPSYEALKVAAEFAYHFSARLCLVHVVEPIPPLAGPGDFGGFNVVLYQKELEASAKKSLQEAIAKMLPKELKVCTFVAYGNPAEEIVRIAEAEAVDLIVIATHGRSGWHHLLFGSVAERVMRHATHPVLSIRTSRK